MGQTCDCDCDCGFAAVVTLVRGMVVSEHLRKIQQLCRGNRLPRWISAVCTANTYTHTYTQMNIIHTPTNHEHTTIQYHKTPPQGPTLHQLTIASAIALAPNDLATRHFFAALTSIRHTLAQALLFRGIRLPIHVVQFDHAVVLVGPVTLVKKCSVQGREVNACSQPACRY